MIALKKLGSYQTAFLLGLVWLIGLSIVFSVVFNTFSAEGFGRLLGITMLASALAGFQAKRAKNPWSMLKFNLVYVAFIIGVLVVSSYPSLKNA